MKTCVMNCGPSTKDLRSRADVMRDCQDCEDWPAPISMPTQAEADVLLADVLAAVVDHPWLEPIQERIRAYLKERQA